MRKKIINSQMTNYLTYKMLLRQMLTLAENVFSFDNLPSFIDIAYLNKYLLSNGSIAFFKDEVMGVLALPYVTVGPLDVYNRPVNIRVMGANGYIKYLKRGEFVIMYDNNGRYPLYMDIIQYAERLAMCVRTNDINISQQKTNRVWKTTPEQEQSVRRLINNVDAYENEVLTYSNLDLNQTNAILNIAPYVADKIDEHGTNLWNEFLRLIGISNISYFKKERNISDEINMMQGGTIASRYARYEPRLKAIKEINKMFGTNIKVGYYDGVPNSEEPTIKNIESNNDFLESGDDNVL